VQAWVTTPDRSKLLAREPDAVFGAAAPDGAVIEVDPAVRFQQMAGFGAAITDASGWLIQQRLDPRRNAMRCCANCSGARRGPASACRSRGSPSAPRISRVPTTASTTCRPASAIPN
jgi:O-glycosyl hydrolase